MDDILDGMLGDLPETNTTDECISCGECGDQYFTIEFNVLGEPALYCANCCIEPSNLTLNYFEVPYAE